MQVKKLAERTLAAAALAFAVAPGAEAQLQHTTIALSTIAGIFASDYIAQDAGIYKKNGLDVKEELIAGISDAKEFETAENLNVEAGFMNPSEKAKSYQNMFTNEYLQEGE